MEKSSDKKTSKCLIHCSFCDSLCKIGSLSRRALEVRKLLSQSPHKSLLNLFTAEDCMIEGC